MSPKPLSAAGQRIVETADRLFYQEGIRAVGIDRIIAEAGVAKMTLYSYFKSKDELILAVLRHREKQVLSSFQAAMGRHSRRSKDAVRAFFASLKDWFESEDFRGCAFQNATVELADPDHPGRAFARQHKRRFADRLRDVVEESIGPKAARVAPAIGLLVEGAIMTAVVQGTSQPADVARDATLALLDSVRDG